MLDVLVTMPFGEALLDKIRQVSPEVRLTRSDPGAADYSRAEVLYAGTPPADLARAPRLRWVQVHMAGVNTLLDHQIFSRPDIALTTTSGVHAVAVAEYAITMMLA